MPNLIYQHGTDNVLGLATITVTTEHANFPKANLHDGNPAKPFKMTAATGDISADFGSARRVDLVAIIMHNLTAGLEVRIQGSPDNFASTPLNELITIPAYLLDGFPVNPWLDLTNKTGYLVGGYRYWRLRVVGTNTANVAIGELWLGTVKRSLLHNIRDRGRPGVFKPIIEQPTAGEVASGYDLQLRIRSFQESIETTDAGFDAIEQWWDSCRGRFLPTLIVRDPAKNDACLVKWQAKREHEDTTFNVKTIEVAWRELSRGSPL